VGNGNGNVTTSGDNEAQIQYWNSAAGEKWVRHHPRHLRLERPLQQAFIDQQLEVVTDLLLEAAVPRPGEAALDVGCGTGDTLLRLAAAVGKEGYVLGCDISAPMLTLARQRIAAVPGCNVEVIQTDAQSHQFEESAFDLLVSRFGVMFFADPTSAFSNLRQSLRLGGRLAFVCWAPLVDNPLFFLPMQVATRHLGPAEPTPPRAPGPLAFSERDYVGDILAATGWSDIRIEDRQPPLLGSATLDEQAAFALEMGPVARLIGERQPDAATVAALRGDLAQELAPYANQSRIELPSRLYYVTARRGP
jgi:SAM-dependent methyltransferase